MALLAVYVGSQRIPTATAPATPAEAIQAKWATLVYDSKTISWIGDPAIMAATAAKGLEMRYISINEDALNQMHLLPQVKAIGTPALILQGSDGHIVHMGKVATIDEVVKVLNSVTEPAK